MPPRARPGERGGGEGFRPLNVSAVGAPQLGGAPGSARGSNLLKEIPILDAVLEAHAAELGGDFTAYRNHAYRVVNFGAAFAPADSVRLEKFATAVAFHDLGIWTDHTFDYLEPSVRLARAHLSRVGREEWAPEIAEMILRHHKISPYRPQSHWLVESLRRADWVDVSRGLVTFGLPRRLVREILATWPNAGFHRRLLLLELKRLRTHPWNPLPMMKL